ncbi:HNH endonuclease signature motif containing protein [Heyndrickxia acidiproducens]|uniref:HNH endonuclease signature motif containing protein n=1 Tax=Heyndrickxia acidiproducens TaxID=1121084 RepID=UPI00036C6EEC|nr:HNH endonuclease signature motif containing protein [Heyndrickxia acidiproducens]
MTPVLLSVQLQVDSRNGITDAPTTYASKNLIFEASEIKTGAQKSLSVKAKTAYLTLYGAFGALMADGTPNYFSISPSTILTNKLNQYFPNYIDPVSGKQAIDGVRTDWQRTGSHPWNGRNAYIKQFESIYGDQPDSYWSAVQIHHIRPRNFGGSDEFDKLMPVETTAHRLITTWFVNY